MESKKRLLIADDEEGIRELLVATLSHDDRYEILLARDGEEALNTARAEVPDLVFLDVLMPKMDGYSVCRELKRNAETSSIKIIMLTAMAQEADRQLAIDAGADDYFTKPFSPTALLNKMESALMLESGANPFSR